MAGHIHDLGHGVKVEDGLGEGPTVTSTEVGLGWRPTAGQFVGTAVNWQDRLFEVRSVIRDTDGERWQLVPWPKGEVARNIDHLDITRIEKLVAEAAVVKNSRSIRLVLVLLSPVVSFVFVVPSID